SSGLPTVAPLSRVFQCQSQSVCSRERIVGRSTLSDLLPSLEPGIAREFHVHAGSPQQFLGVPFIHAPDANEDGDAFAFDFRGVAHEEPSPGGVMRPSCHAEKPSVVPFPGGRTVPGGADPWSLGPRTAFVARVAPLASRSGAWPRTGCGGSTGRYCGRRRDE